MIRLLVLCLSCLPVRALVLTNGPDASVTAPTNGAVGWRYLAENGAWTACGPRLVCSVQHVASTAPVYGGQTYPIVRLIEPPGSDVRFAVVDRDLPAYAKLWTTTNSMDVLPLAYIVGGGVGTGQVQGGTNFYWGAEGNWPDGTRRLRWGHSFSLILGSGERRFSWRSDQCGASSGDSGYAVFAGDGRYVGPIQWGSNPVTLGNYQSGGAIASGYHDWIKDYLPGAPTNTPAKPRSVGALTAKAVP